MIALEIPNCLGIGDAIQFSHIPENIFYFTGEKVFDVSNCWIFDHNPYVERNSQNAKIKYKINLWETSKYFKYGYKSHAERFFDLFNELFGTNFKNPILRSPRLYFKENEKIFRNRVLVHTTGKSEKVPLSDDVINQIAANYKDCEIIQIGGSNDKNTPFKKMLGLSVWETATLISCSAIFIGVNSGMMNIANCYPKIWKKILVSRDEEIFVPLSKENVWFDYNNTYYNYTKADIGTTYSYLKI